MFQWVRQTHNPGQVYNILENNQHYGAKKVNYNKEMEGNQVQGQHFEEVSFRKWNVNKASQESNVDTIRKNNIIQRRN